MNIPGAKRSTLVLVAAALSAACFPPTMAKTAATDASPSAAASSSGFAADVKAAELGKEYFNRACTYCHGKEGAGGKTPSFKGRKDFTADALFNVISNGRVNGANVMPAWKGSLKPEQISQLVSYILSLAKQPADDD